jgi:hypothetical protein
MVRRLRAMERPGEAGNMGRYHWDWPCCCFVIQILVDKVRRFQPACWVYWEVRVAGHVSSSLTVFVSVFFLLFVGGD